MNTILPSSASAAIGRRLALPAASLFAALTFTQSLSATPLYWDGNGTTAGAGNTTALLNKVWGTDAAWNSDAAGVTNTFTASTTSSDDLFFVAAPGAASGAIAFNPTVTGTQAANSITFQSSGAQTLSGGTINIGAGGITGAQYAYSTTNRGTVSISSALALQANQSWINNAATAMAVSGAVSGTADLTLQNNAAGTFAISTGGINNTGTITNSGSGTGTATISGVIGTNVTGVTQNSSTSALTLSGANTFTGNVTVSAGTLTLSHLTAAGASTNTITLGGGASNVTLISSVALANYDINVLSGAGTVALTGIFNNTGSKTITLNDGQGLTVNNGSSHVMTRRILESSGSSAVTLNASAAKFSTAQFGNTTNSYSGGTTINGTGWVSIATGGTGSFFGTGPLTINGAVNIDQQSAAATVNGISQLILNSDFAVGGASGSGSVTFAATVPVNLGATGTTTDRTFNLNTSGSTNSLTINGVISDGTNGTTKGIIKAGPGLLVLAGANNYTGSTTVNNGTLTVNSTGKVGSGDLAANNTNTGVGNATVVNFSSAQTVGALSGAISTPGSGTNTSTINLTGVGTTLTLKQNANTVYDGVLAGTGKLTLDASSTGKLVLTGSNTYTGATTLNAGTLVVNGSLASGSAVSVGASATLGGSGTIGGTVAVAGTLSPGNSPGLLTTGAETWSNGGNYNWQIVDATGAAGTGFDSIAITSGGLNLTSLTTGGFNINLWSLSGTGPDVNGNALNFDNGTNHSWTLVSNTGDLTSVAGSVFTIDVAANNGTSGFSNALAGGSFSVVGNVNSLDLVFTAAAIPEPSACAALAGMLTLAGAVWRRRTSARTR